VTDYYFDASALVKRYAEKSGSTWVREITGPSAQHTILLAEITLAEVAAALAAKRRAPGGITQDQQVRILSRFCKTVASTLFCSQKGKKIPQYPIKSQERSYKKARKERIPYPRLLPIC
jgi:predicted nucleic acid-binding protein